jgi:tetratricopeptide (TPR) repeat protein
VREGQQALRVTSPDPSDTWFYQEVMLKRRQWYHLSGWVRTRGLDAHGAPVSGTFMVQTPGESRNIVSRNYAGDTEWTEVRIAFQAPAGGLTRICVCFACSGRGTGMAWFDDLKLVEASQPPSEKQISEQARKQAVAANNEAWLLATNPDAKLRDPARAIELAQKSAKLAPKEAICWNTLGVAHYRAGHWKEAIAALTSSMELQKGALESFDTFFLAMAHWQLGEKDKARQSYGRAAQWLDKNKDHLAGRNGYLEELARFRAEAAELLGIEKKKEEPKIP